MNHTKIGIIGVAIALLVIVGAVFILQGSVSPTGSSEDTCTYTKSGDEDLGCAVARIAAGQTNPGSESNDDVVPVEKIIITSPLSPAQTTTTNPGGGKDKIIPLGATIEHTLVGNIPVTIIYDKDGETQFWVDDRQATTLSTFQNMSVPATRIHQVPEGTVIDHTTPGIITASDPKTKNIILKIIDHTDKHVSGNQYQSLVGICSESIGCYVADIYGNDVFTSLPFDDSLDYHPKFTRISDGKTSEVKMSVCKATKKDPYNCTDEKYSTGLSALTNPDTASPANGNSSPAPLIQMPCGWIGVSPSISSNGMAVTFGSWINWVWYPLAGVPTIDVDFQNQLYRDFGSGYTQLIQLGKNKAYSGVGLAGVSDTNTYTVSSAGDYFTVTVMDWQVPPSATCVPASGSGMFQTSPNLAVP